MNTPLSSRGITDGWEARNARLMASGTIVLMLLPIIMLVAAILVATGVIR